ncbi:hypothetical protein GCM10022243_09170 [Saccharothrix violaceirubra]
MLPDAPVTGTRCPGRTESLSRRKYGAVVAPSTAAADSANDRRVGLGASEPDAGMRAYSACPPTAKPVNPNTSSPGANRVTDDPAESTTPATSRPGVRGPRRGRRRPRITRPHTGSPRRMVHSADVTVVAWTLIRTSSARGTGRGASTTSTTSTTSAGPNPVWTEAFMGGR